MSNQQHAAFEWLRSVATAADAPPLAGVALESWHEATTSRSTVMSEALAEMEARKDAAYLERNQVVAALAKAFPSGVGRTAIEGWSEDWHGCVYIDLPTGQASWHFHDSQAYLFADLPPYTGTWDGHDTPEKYCRLAALTVTLPVPRTGTPSQALLDVVAERQRQDAKWGGPRHDDCHSTAEFVRLIQDYTAGAQLMAEMGRADQARRRLVQVSALAVAAAESITRKGRT